MSISGVWSISRKTICSTGSRSRGSLLIWRSFTELISIFGRISSCRSSNLAEKKDECWTRKALSRYTVRSSSGFHLFMSSILLERETRFSVLNFHEIYIIYLLGKNSDFWTDSKIEYMRELCDEDELFRRFIDWAEDKDALQVLDFLTDSQNAKFWRVAGTWKISLELTFWVHY